MAGLKALIPQMVNMDFHHFSQSPNLTVPFLSLFEVLSDCSEILDQHPITLGHGAHKTFQMKVLEFNRKV